MIVTKNSSLEAYILKQITKRQKELAEMAEHRADYSETCYLNKFHRLHGQIDELYMCLTGHDNNYAEQKNNKN